MMRCSVVLLGMLLVWNVAATRDTVEEQKVSGKQSVPLSHYPVNLAARGPIFDGVGAISGGGGETVLLPAYPETQREEILDILFKPFFGASLHILKVEIGGDSLSTDGAEPSHMHTEEATPNFHRGYEFWLANEAKKRNPSILLYALPWEWPAWVGEGTGKPFHNITKAVYYTMQWLHGARSTHGLNTDFVGVWNENAYSTEYILALRQALDRDGFGSTRIIAPDGSNKSAQEFFNETLQDSALAAATHAVGFHYPNSAPGIRSTGNLAVWASEDISTVSPPRPDDEMRTLHPRALPGGGCLVRTLNENFIQGDRALALVTLPCLGVFGPCLSCLLVLVCFCEALKGKG